MSPLKSCPACAGQVSPSAKTCPHCGHPLPPPVIASIWDGLVKFALVAAVLLVIGFFVLSKLVSDLKPGTEHSGQPAPDNDAIAAIRAKAEKDGSLAAYLAAVAYCKTYAPSGDNFTTAAGEPVSEGHARRITNDYHVPNWIAVGYVDAQNQFGAVKLQKWYASVVPSAEKWKLMFLKIGDEDFVNHYESP